MAEIKGTSGPDVYELKTDDLYQALEGDDRITITGRWGTVQPGPGNDTVIVDPSLNGQATLWYWSSPNAVYVDLKAGYALDGFGTRDTLVGIRFVHGLKMDGDRGFGTEQADLFHVGPGSSARSGRILIDGRGGEDTASFGVGGLEGRGLPVVKVSADGRQLKIWFENTPGFVTEFRNFEWLNLSYESVNQSIRVADRASLELAGQDILLRGAAGWQTRAPGSPVTLSYSFLTERPAEGAEGGAGFLAFNPTQQQVVRELLAGVQRLTGLQFREVSAVTGDIRFGINDQASTRGYSFLPDAHRGQVKAGDVWLDVETSFLLSPGAEGYYVLLHELGHALGLQHPLPESDTSGDVVLLERLANFTHTVMIDRSAAQTGNIWPMGYGVMDLQALRYLYGGGGMATGPDRYALSHVLQARFLTLVDDGGEDTIDASASGVGVMVDLRQGHTSSMGVSSTGEVLHDNLVVGIGTVIEHAVGTPMDDLIIGNGAANRIQGNGGSDIIDGQDGLDWAVFSGKRQVWGVDPGLAKGTWFVSARDGAGGATELRSVERVRFDDAVVAYDLGRTDNTGKALLLLGAVIGRAATLSKAPLVGAVVDFLDQGVSLEALAGAIMRLPIWGGVLTPTNSSEDIARHLLKVTTGVEPSAADVAAGARAISGQPQGAYLAGLALGDPNVAQVGLTGLAATGFEYPVG